jgi:hypothetical protein
MVEHALISDFNLQSRVRNRYKAEVASLQRLGFQILGFCLETEGPFSAIFQLPILLLMLPKREVLVFPRPLRLAVATVLLRHSDPSTIALCMGKGVKFYTAFTDNTLLISSSFRSYAVPRPTSQIIRPFPATLLEAVWPAHSEHVRQLEREGGLVHPTVTFDEFLQLSRREEDLSQYE